MSGAARRAPAMPAPTCIVAMTNHNGFEGPPAAGSDVVIDVTGDLVHLFIPVPGLLAKVRLTFTPEQLGALMDELVEAADLVTA
jgi:hypothetical protein